jgi:hypothetical protein
VYSLIPLAKLLPLTNGPKKDLGWKDEGYYVFSSYFLLLLRLTDWALRCKSNKYIYWLYQTDFYILSESTALQVSKCLYILKWHCQETCHQNVQLDFILFVDKNNQIRKSCAVTKSPRNGKWRYLESDEKVKLCTWRGSLRRSSCASAWSASYSLKKRSHVL